MEVQEQAIIKKKKDAETRIMESQKRTQKLLVKCNENMQKAAEENTMLQGYLKAKAPEVMTPKTPLQLAVESKEKGDASELTKLFMNLIDAVGTIAGCLPEATQRDKAIEAMEGLQSIVKAAGGQGTSTRTLEKSNAEESDEAIAAKKLRTDEQK